MTTQPPIEPLHITRAMILEEAAECDALANASQREADAAWDRGDAQLAMMCERNVVQMRRSARWYRAYADSPDGYPPAEEEGEK